MDFINGEKIKIILITGFLGSGKTTFLNKLVNFYSQRKIALIVNDFGKIAVDGILLQNKIDNELNTKMYEISNGSIFCSCLSTELVNALKFFITKKPEILIIETSGLSDPSTFHKILKDNKLEKYYDIYNSVCIVDTIKTIQLLKKITAIEKQIISSNIIVINKVDLINETEIYKVVQEIKILNNKAIIIATSYVEFDLEILEKNKKQNFSINSNTCNTVNNRPATLFLEQQEMTINKLENFYERVNRYILRIKGFLKINEKLYYVSNNNDKLKIENKDSYKITDYGLSVISYRGSENKIEKEWKRI